MSHSNFAILFVKLLFVFTVGFCLDSFKCWGQTDDSIPGALQRPEAADKSRGDDLVSLLQEYREALSQLRESLMQAKQAQFGYKFGSYDDSDQWMELWNQAFQKGKQSRDRLNDIVYQIVIQSDDLDEEIIDLARTIIGPMFEEYQYERVFQISDRLDRIISDENDERSKQDIIVMKARSALITNRFDIAKEYFEKMGEVITKLDESELELFRQLTTFSSAYETEQTIRLVETQADDLPLVEFVTTEGNFVAELFENQYPDTVAHFLDLVETGYYQDIPFHRVTKNILPFSMAQAGKYQARNHPDTGQLFFFERGANFTIFDEPPQGELRPHFRGVLSMTKAYSEDGKPIPNTGSTQFFITLVPLLMLDNQHVPFGRVISNLDVIDKLKHNTEINKKDGKEKIIEDPEFSILREVKILRKRDREYIPKRISKSGTKAQ